MLGKLLAGVAGGFVVGVFASAVTGLPAGANFAVATAGRYVGLITGWLVALVLALVAPTPRRAWGRICIACGLLCMLMPLAALLLGATGVGGPMAGRVWQVAPFDIRLIGNQVAIIASIAGFFLGAAFFAVALWLEEGPETTR